MLVVIQLVHFRSERRVGQFVHVALLLVVNSDIQVAVFVIE
jgi:hypothetical protein